MGCYGVSIALGLFVVLTCFTTLHAQTSLDPCKEGGTITITFPAADPNSTPPRMERSVSSVSDKDYTITVTQYPAIMNPTYRFDDYFSIGYNPQAHHYYISNTKGISLNGPTSGAHDDVLVLQYQFQCRSTVIQQVVFSVLKVVITRQK